MAQCEKRHVTFWVGHLPSKWQRSQATRSLFCHFLSNVRRSLYLEKKVMRYYSRDLRGHHLQRYLAKCKADYIFTSQTLGEGHYFPHAWRVNRLTSVSYSTESMVYMGFNILILYYRWVIVREKTAVKVSMIQAYMHYFRSQQSGK